MADPIHTHGGNCWCHECCYPHEDSPDMLDVCLKHGEPRGECDECPQCAICDEGAGPDET